jgi:hypothetical protein
MKLPGLVVSGEEHKLVVRIHGEYARRSIPLFLFFTALSAKFSDCSVKSSLSTCVIGDDVLNNARRAKHWGPVLRKILGNT